MIAKMIIIIYYYFVNKYLIKMENKNFAGKQRTTDTSFMDQLSLSSFSPLENLEKRGNCPKCKAKRKYYCYDCIVPVGDGLP